MEQYLDISHISSQSLLSLPTKLMLLGKQRKQKGIQWAEGSLMQKFGYKQLAIVSGAQHAGVSSHNKYLTNPHYCIIMHTILIYRMDSKAMATNNTSRQHYNIKGLSKNLQNFTVRFNQTISHAFDHCMEHIRS